MHSEDNKQRKKVCNEEEKKFNCKTLSQHLNQNQTTVYILPHENNI